MINLRSLRVSLMASALCVLAGCAANGTKHVSQNLMVSNVHGQGNVINENILSQTTSSLAGELSREGFYIVDNAKVLHAVRPELRIRLGESEIADAARQYDSPPIDGLLLYTITVDAQEKPYTTKLSVTMDATLIDLISGRTLDNVIANKGPVAIAPDCKRNCMLAEIKTISRGLAYDIAAQIPNGVYESDSGNSHGAEGESGKPIKMNTFKLYFGGFPTQEFELIEEYLLAFTGFIDLRCPVFENYSMECIYETEISGPRLNRNLYRALQDVSIPGKVSSTPGGFTIKKISVNPAKTPEGIKRKERFYNW